MTNRVLSTALTCLFIALGAAADSWDCEVYPAEHRIETEPVSGARLIFATTDSADDVNFYFHHPCFMLDNQVMLFFTYRFGGRELMGYLVETGELVRLRHPDRPGLGLSVASRHGNTVYGHVGNAVLAWDVELSTEPKTAVRVTERRVFSLPEGQAPRGLTENADGTLLLVSTVQGEDALRASSFVVHDLEKGETRKPISVPFRADHLQFSWERPSLLSFNRIYEGGTDRSPTEPGALQQARVWLMDLNVGVALPAFFQEPGEVATHECWWVHDQITFIGGFNKDGDAEDGHMKVFDLKTGEIRIVGAGAWVPGTSASDIARVNWWHGSGSPDGRWVAADNWHGIVALFDAKTTETRILTTNHRTYGQGEHLHVGWDMKGRYVEFTSNRNGNKDVCLVEVPRDW